MVDRSSQHPTGPTPTHNPKTCNLCASLRHPAQSKNGRALAKHLKTNPLPRQQAHA